jgi:hypothetical protein
VNQISSIIDVTPTLLDFCGVAKSERVNFDGRSLVPLLRGETTNSPDRTLIFQWHRGDAPERYRCMAVRSQDWKLVQPLGSGGGEGAGNDNWNGKTEFQLFDLAHDPFEMHNVAEKNPERVAALKTAYDAWFDDMTNSRDFNVPQRIFVGTPKENPVLLTRQDWRGPQANWSPEGIGYWELNVVTNAHYDIKFRFDSAKADGAAKFICSGVSTQQPIKAGYESCVFKDIQLPAGPARLEATLQEGAAVLGVKYVEVKRQN